MIRQAAIKNGYPVPRRSYVVEGCAETATEDSNGQAQNRKSEGDDGTCDEVPQNEAEVKQRTMPRVPGRRHDGKEGHDWARDQDQTVPDYEF